MTVSAGTMVDSKRLGPDVSSLLEQGVIVAEGDSPTVPRPPTPYVDIDHAKVVDAGPDEPAEDSPGEEAEVEEVVNGGGE